MAAENGAADLNVCHSVSRVFSCGRKRVDTRAVIDIHESVTVRAKVNVREMPCVVGRRRARHDGAGRTRHSDFIDHSLPVRAETVTSCHASGVREHGARWSVRQDAVDDKNFRLRAASARELKIHSIRGEIDGVQIKNNILYVRRGADDLQRRAVASRVREGCDGTVARDANARRVGKVEPMRQTGWERALRTRARRSVARARCALETQLVRRRVFKHVLNVCPNERVPSRNVVAEPFGAVEHVGHVLNFVHRPRGNVAIEKFCVAKHVIHTNHSRGVPRAQILIEPLPVVKQVLHVNQPRRVPQRNRQAGFAASRRALATPIQSFDETRAHCDFQGVIRRKRLDVARRGWAVRVARARKTLHEARTLKHVRSIDPRAHLPLAQISIEGGSARKHAVHTRTIIAVG